MFAWVLLLILLVIILFLLYSYRGFFLLNDVTTTPQDPPQYNKIKTLIGDREMVFSERDAIMNVEHYGNLHPLKLEMSVDAAYRKVVETAEKMHAWEIIYDDPASHRLEVVATTSFMQYRDDVVIEVRPAGSNAAEVHMRSASRVGRGDFGANAKRMKAFFNALEQASTPK